MDKHLLKKKTNHSLDDLTAEIRTKGGAPIQLFPPNYVIAILPPGVELRTGEPISEDAGNHHGSAARTAIATLRRHRERAARAGAPAPMLSWDTKGKKPPVFEHVEPMPMPPPPGLGLSTGTPTSRFLIGRVAVAVVIVGRERGTDAAVPAEFLSQAERDLAAVEAADGLGWLATLELAAAVEFVFERYDIELNIAPSTTTPDEYEARERVWRDPALAQLGLPAGRDGYARLAREVRDRNNARWGYVLFITRYPLHHFAYASVERVVQHFDNDGWGTPELNRVIAHETCHIFGALDEYETSKCSCTEAGGELDVVNGNCKPCAGDKFAPCIMEANTLAICDYTRGQIGWRAPLMPPVQNGSLWREANGAIWIVFGGARFHVPDMPTLDRLYGGNPITQVSNGSLVNLSTIPTSGTMLREENGTIWVVFGDAKFHVPDMGTLQRLFDGWPIHQLWNGAPAEIPSEPRDGILLREETGAIWVTFGGAKFHVPDPDTLTRLYNGWPMFQLWDGSVAQIPDAPRGGTLLREENGAIWIIAGGAKFHVPDLVTLQRLYGGWPIHQLWDGSVYGIGNTPADGTLFREESSSQVFVIIDGRKQPAAPGTPGQVHLVWNGALTAL